MKSSRFSSFFYFSKIQSKGILFLFLIIVILQCLIFFVDFTLPKQKSNTEENWMSLQLEIDSAKKKELRLTPKIYPFNPNFISDYKGYKLGMSVQEIDRLHAFRSKNKYINSAEEFQKVTLVSDSFIKKWAPYFKFPEWVTKKHEMFKFSALKLPPKTKSLYDQKDINLATKEDLVAIYGIGEKLAVKILTEKERLGGFVSMDQLQYIWGISPEAIGELQKHFTIKNTTTIIKLKINDLSLKELSKFPYFNYALAKEIVIYRTMNHGIKEIADLTKIKGMPNDKIKIIALYLDF
jgi:DNA uptake protein ComE-like DNA-binding protein